jgi:hypothetical protein
MGSKDSGKGFNVQDNEQMDMWMLEKQHAERLKEAMLNWINDVEHTRGHIPELELHSRKKMVEKQLSSLTTSILVEASEEEKWEMWPLHTFVSIPEADAVVKWALL